MTYFGSWESGLMLDLEGCGYPDSRCRIPNLVSSPTSRLNGYNWSMATALTVSGIAFAALCVWLSVRFVNRRERWVKWTAAGLVFALFYPLSLGPACWITSRLNAGAGCISSIYRPVVLLMIDGPVDLTEQLDSFSMFGADPTWLWDLDPIGREPRWVPMSAIDWTGRPMVTHIYPEPRSKDEPANSTAQNSDTQSESN